MRNPIHSPARRRGVALIIVLGLLVIILGLAVTFLNRTSLERNASASYAASASTRQLGDLAVNLVQGQIHNATSQGSAIAWASQPGMIRSFNTSGNLAQAYKLYSSDNLIATSTANLTTSDIPPATWAADTAVWTDLNAPVTANGTANFPILDPGAIGNVEGFSIDSTTQPAGTSATAIPMPVKWLYVLQDGTLAPPTGSDGKKPSIAGATATNPIVGRIAFWTDDESCKLNLNTASEGTYWDSPTTNLTTPDITMALTQPAQNEFQRYPGHPATVSLAPVFWKKFGLPTATSTLDPLLTPRSPIENTTHVLPSYALNYYQNIYNLIPRVVQGGSNQGTTNVSTNTGIAKSSLDQDRLFSSIDEALIKPDRSIFPGIDQTFVEQSRFFLTTSSKAPEVTQFDTPKVAVWPLNTSSARRTAKDELIAFCSSLQSGGSANPYHFTRSDPNSPTADFSSRNLQNYNYLVNLMGRDVPGASPTGSFSSKYGSATVSQITTEIFDYIRSCVNLLDSSGPSSNRYQYAYATPPTSGMSLTSGSGQVVPILHPSNGTKGFGRFPTVKSAAIVFVALNANQPPLIDLPVNPGTERDEFRALLEDPTKDFGALLDAGLPTERQNFFRGSPNFTSAEQAIHDKYLNPMHPFILTGGVTKLWPFTIPVPGFTNPNLYPTFGGKTHKSLRFTGEPSVVPAPTDLAYTTALAANPFQKANSIYDGPVLTPGQTQMQAYFVLDLVQPAQGYVGRIERFKIRVTGLNNFTAGPNLGLPADATQTITGQAGSQAREQGYTFGVGNMLGGKRLSDPDVTRVFPFNGAPIVVSGATFPFTGGDITVELLSYADQVVQTLTIPFPNATFPTPLLSAAPPSQATLSPAFVQAAGDPYPPANQTQLAFNTSSGALDNTLANRLEKAVYNEGMSVLFFAAGANTPPADRNWKQTADTIRSIEAVYSDTRLIGAMKNVPRTMFAKNAAYDNTSIRAAHSFRTGAGYGWRGAILPKLTTAAGNYWISANQGGSLLGGSPVNDRNPAVNAPDLNSQVDLTNATFLVQWNQGGDFDNGIPGIPDGPYINKADEGNNSTPTPYWNGWGANEAIGATLFSPNRQIASAVSFGSLPTGVNSGTTGGTAQPWQTLLFNPNPNSSSQGANHRSLTLGGPRDYNLLDLFWMPVVEPYAISEPFATSGKVNMNYRIAPFNYIKRDTALRGVLRSARILAVPESWIEWYRGQWGTYPGNPGNWASGTLNSAASSSGYNYFRYPIHAGQTLKAFEERFDNNDVFRSASEICGIYLYPARQPSGSDTDAPATALVTRADSGSNRDAAVKNWWYSGDAKSLTGDNLRERPYSYLYPLLTTKSNTYTVHYRVQALKKTKATAAGVWDEAGDKITGEYRGSTTIERYINPNDTNIPDYPTNLAKIDSDPLGKYYKWRVVGTRQFAP